MNITPKDLLDAGVHLGHQTKRWNPRSKPYIFDHRQGITIIDLEKTHAALEKACGQEVHLISGVSGAGVDTVLRAMAKEIRNRRKPQTKAAKAAKAAKWVP